MDRIVQILDTFLKMDSIDLSYADVSRVQKFQEIETFFAASTTETKEAALLIYITKCDRANPSQLKFLFDTLEKLVENKILNVRLICEQILNSEKLDFKNELFFCSCFKLIKRLIGGVDYKGVREIMKICREKANSFPRDLSTSILPQLIAVYNVLEYIFDRNACLLPAYFIITELQKQENADVHWKISNLTATFTEVIFVDPPRYWTKPKFLKLYFRSSPISLRC